MSVIGRKPSIARLTVELERMQEQRLYDKPVSLHTI
jgi:hypothetical protein